MGRIEDLLCATLRGENPHWPEDGDDRFVAGFLERSAYHGVQALLHHHLQIGQSAEFGWPKVVLDACRNQAVAQAMWELRHQHLLDQVLARLAAIEVRPILFKGTALAYDLFPTPFLRTRGDTDLIVPPHMRDQVVKVLETLGFKCEPGVSGDFVSYQGSYSRRDSAANTSHTLDLHWKVNNSQLLSKLFSYQELHSEARLLPALSADAVAVHPVHALVLACMHRAVHKQAPYYVDGVAYHDGDRLIWLYDIHLLIGILSPSQHHEFVELAERKGLRATCLEGLERTRARFHTLLPEAVYRPLARPGPAEAAARYLSGSASYQLYADFRAVEGLRNKLRFLAELLFPPESYMRQKYPQADPSWLPWLYLRRAGSGFLKRSCKTDA
jgi:hypothetical protein